jgi:hypothetical protein
VVVIRASLTSFGSHAAGFGARLWIEGREPSDIGEAEVVLRRGHGCWTGRMPDGLFRQSSGFLYRLTLSSTETLNYLVFSDAR